MKLKFALLLLLLPINIISASVTLGSKNQDRLLSFLNSEQSQIQNQSHLSTHVKHHQIEPRKELGWNVIDSSDPASSRDSNSIASDIVALKSDTLKAVPLLVSGMVVMFSLLLSIIYEIADKQLGILALSAFFGALASAFELAQANLDSVLGIRIASQMLFSFSETLSLWWIFLFCSSCGAWEPLSGPGRLAHTAEELEDGASIEDERRSFHSMEESFSCFKTSAPRSTPHYVVSMGPRRSAISFNQLSLLALLLLFVFGVLDISWRITLLFQAEAGVALMRSCQVFALLILGFTSSVLILGLVKSKTGAGRSAEFSSSSQSSSSLLMILALLGNLVGFAVALGSEASPGFGEEVAGRICKAIQFLIYGLATILCAWSIAKALKTSSRASLVTPFRSSHPITPPPVYESPNIGSMPNFNSRSISAPHCRNSSLSNRCKFAFASSSNRLTALFSSRKPDGEPTEKYRESSIPMKAPALDLNLHRSLPPLPLTTSGGGIDRSSGASLLSIDIDRLFTRFRVSFMLSQRGSNLPDVPRSVTMRESSESPSTRPQTTETSRTKRPATAESGDSEVSDLGASDFEHSTIAVVSSASAVPATSFNKSSDPVTLKRGGSARYVHYSGKKSICGSVSLWGGSNRSSFPMSQSPLPPTPLSPHPPLPQRLSIVKSCSQFLDGEPQSLNFPANQEPILDAIKHYLSPLSRPNTRDSITEASTKKHYSGGSIVVSSSGSDETPPSIREGRLKLITSFPDPPQSPGPISSDTFGRGRFGSKGSTVSSTSSNKSSKSPKAHLRKDSNATFKQSRGRQDAEKPTKAQIPDDKEKFEFPKIEESGSNLKRSDTVTSFVERLELARQNTLKASKTNKNSSQSRESAIIDPSMDSETSFWFLSNDENVRTSEHEDRLSRLLPEFGSSDLSQVPIPASHQFPEDQGRISVLSISESEGAPTFNTAHSSNSNFLQVEEDEKITKCQEAGSSIQKKSRWSAC